MEALNIFWRNTKWRFQNPATILMTLLQPLFWLLLFSTMFSRSMTNDGTSSNYTAFLLPGILVMVILSSAGMSGIANYSLKSGGVFYRIYISPVKRTSIILGHILDAVLLSFLEGAVLIILSCLLRVRIATGLPGLIFILFLMFLTSFFTAGLSYALSFAFRDENPFIALVNTFLLPLYFISTALMPYDQIPKVFRIPVTVNPFTYVINSLRNLIIDHQIDWGQLLISILLMTLLSTGSFLMAVRSLKKTE